MQNTQDLLIENQLLKKVALRNKVVLLVLLVLMVCSTVFAYTQRLEAQQQKSFSEELMHKAQEAQNQAAVHAALASQVEQMCNQKLIECEMRNK
ncbi:MAG: hypothetical protein EBU52_11905 [Cytophagia bacterium]|nr:hypothetical protein [Cytophagia bacterium]